MKKVQELGILHDDKERQQRGDAIYKIIIIIIIKRMKLLHFETLAY